MDTQEKLDQLNKVLDEDQKRTRARLDKNYKEGIVEFERQAKSWNRWMYLEIAMAVITAAGFFASLSKDDRISMVICFIGTLLWVFNATQSRKYRLRSLAWAKEWKDDHAAFMRKLEWIDKLN